MASMHAEVNRYTRRYLSEQHMCGWRRVLEEKKDIKIKKDTLELRRLKKEKREKEQEPSEIENPRETLTLRRSTLLTWRREVKREKYRRRHQLLVLERKEQRLQEQTAMLEQRQRDLIVRECIVSENELLLPIVKRLQNMGMDLDSVMPWFQTISEVSQMQKTDYKTSATYVAYELSSYRKLMGVQTELELAQTRLEMIKMATTQRERGLNVLAELESKGVSLDVVYELSKVLDLVKIAKELSVMTNPWSFNGIGINNPVSNGNGSNSQGVNNGSKVPI